MTGHRPVGGHGGMARELSQEEVLDFLCQGGGKVTNASLLGHFKLFLRDPKAPVEQLVKRRERFKHYVNSVAVVKLEGAVKYVVLRSRYRDLLGEEDLSRASASEGSQVVPHGAQVRDGIYSNGCSDLGGCAVVPHQPGAVLISNLSHGALEGKTCEAPSYKEHECHQPSQWPAAAPPGAPPGDPPGDPPASNTPWPQNNMASTHRSLSLVCSNASPSVIRTSAPSDMPYHHKPYMSSTRTSSPQNNAAASLHTSPCTEYSNASQPVIRPSDISYLHPPCLSSRTSSPASSTSSPQNNSSSLHESPAMEYSNASPLIIRTSAPVDKSYLHQPTYAYLSSSKTTLPVSNNTSLQNNAFSLYKSLSKEYSKTSPPAIRTSILQDQSYHQQPMTTNLNALSSPSNKSNSSISHPYHSLSSSAGSLDFPEILSNVPEGRFKVPSLGQMKTESVDPGFINVTSRDREGQKDGCYTCTELQSSNFHLNSAFPPEEHKGYSDYIQDEQQMPPSLYCTMYIDLPHPSPSLLFPHESSIAPQLEDHQPASCSPTPPLPLYDIHEMWMSKMPVFKSIRCQLSLQNMEDFVDQESFGSEGSDSGEGADCDTEHNIDEDPSSDSINDKYVHYIEQKCENTRRCPPTRRFLSINEQYERLKSTAPMDVMGTLADCSPHSARPGLMSAPYSNSPYNRKSFLTAQAPILFTLAKNTPRHKMSSHMQEAMSSSDEELIERDYTRKRRPPRTKRPSNAALVPPQPDVDILLTVKPGSSNHFIPYNTKDIYAQSKPKVNAEFVPNKTFTCKSSPVVPLDSAEHDWSVKLASASWFQVYGLFIEDPSLALQKDFISGFTAFHWFAKHGATNMVHKFVAGAKKAGIQLDANVKSNGGYTPLHIATIHGHHKLAAMLVEKLNVNVKLRDNSGKRAWQYLSCNTSGEVWQLLGAPKGKTIFASHALNISNYISRPKKSSQIRRKSSLAAFLKPQHQRWKANNHPVLREREIYSD